MKCFIAGVIGGIVSVMLSLMWFILGMVFGYEVTRNHGKVDSGPRPMIRYEKENDRRD